MIRSYLAPYRCLVYTKLLAAKPPPSIGIVLAKGTLSKVKCTAYATRQGLTRLETEVLKSSSSLSLLLLLGSDDFLERKGLCQESVLYRMYTS